MVSPWIILILDLSPSPLDGSSIVHDMWVKYGRGHTAISDTTLQFSWIKNGKVKETSTRTAMFLSENLKHPKMLRRFAISWTMTWTQLLQDCPQKEHILPVSSSPNTLSVSGSMDKQSPVSQSSPSLSFSTSFLTAFWPPNRITYSYTSQQLRHLKLRHPHCVCNNKSRIMKVAH